jgi:drug/metabolite transporter (DMT)-like permease
VLTGAPWPRSARAWGHLAVTGLLIQGLHFIGIYESVHLGLPTGVAALLAGLMPVATALGGHLWLGERMTRRQLWGLSGGLAGVLLVVLSKPLHAAALVAYGSALLGLCGLVLGTLYQKRFCADMDLRSGAGIQMAAAAVMASLLAWPIEHFEVRWSGEFIAAMAWIVFVNAIGAFSLMFVMIRRGQTSQVARLFFLVPGVAALMGFVLLGEQLSVLAVFGFVMTAFAVSVSAR